MGRDEPHALRTTVLETVYDLDLQKDVVMLVWSEGPVHRGIYVSRADQERVPKFAAGDQMTFVESEQSWAPTFGVGLGTFRLRDVAISRPRFAGVLKWDATG